MRLINRYVFRTVGAAILLVLSVIVGLDVLSAVIDERSDMAQGYDNLAVLTYVLLTVPSRLYEFLPFAALIGCLAGLGALAGSSELIVIRAAGVSVRRIVWMALKPALAITLVGVVVAEYIAPRTQQIAESMRAVALAGEQPVVSRHGLWHREGDTFMHFAAVQPNGVLLGVTLYEFDASGRLNKAVRAGRATYQDSDWVLESIHETLFYPDHTERRAEPHRRWTTDLSPQLLNILVLDPVDLSISGLWRYTRYLGGQGLNNADYRLAFWNKVLQPLTIVSLVLVAISFVFGPLRQVTMGFRIFIGVLVGVVFRTLQDMLGPASLVYDFPPVYAALIPIVIASTVGLLLLQRR